MNILLINHYAGSIHHGMEYRPYYLAREWLKMGHKVLIVAGSFSHLRQSNISMDGPFKYEFIDDIQYMWIKTPLYHGNGPARAWSMFSFVGKLFRYSRSIAKTFRPNVVIASSTYPLDILPSSRIAKLSKAQLIFEVHDLWPLSPMELGNMSKHHPFIMMMQYAEDYACRHADKIVSMLPRADLHLLTRGMSKEKFCYVPNGIKPDLWIEDSRYVPMEILNTLRSLKETGQFLVGYAGAHGLANALHSFIEAMALLKKNNVTAVLIGSGPEKDSLQKKAALLSAENVVFFDRIDKKAIPTVLKEFDALYIGLQHSPLFRFGISPNKLMDYMMAAKPIIHAIDTEIDLVRECGCGISCEAENPKAIADAITQLKSLPAEKRRQMGQRGRKYVLKNHNYKVLAARFIEAMQ